MLKSGLGSRGMKSRRYRGGARCALVGAALLLMGCAGDTADLMPEPDGSMSMEEALVWREGSDGTHAFMSENQLIRCWKLNGRFDCLYAEIFDHREQIADAPVRRAYYRFLATRLPDRLSQLSGLDVSDGYECLASVTPERSTLLESIWKNGRVVEQSRTDLHATADAWMREDIAAHFKRHSISPRRPAFACSLVDEIAAKMGLGALDSPVMPYDSLTRKGRPTDVASMETAAE